MVPHKVPRSAIEKLGVSRTFIFFAHHDHLLHHQIFSKSVRLKIFLKSVRLRIWLDQMREIPNKPTQTHSHSYKRTNSHTQLAVNSHHKWSFVPAPHSHTGRHTHTDTNTTTQRRLVFLLIAFMLRL